MAPTQYTTKQKPWSEFELRERLVTGEFCFPPATLRFLSLDALACTTNYSIDGALEVTWQEKRDRFVFEYKIQSTPRSLETAITQAQRNARTLALRPLVIVPYLSETALKTLETEGVSGLDLSGNGVILARDFALRRSGEPNRFKEASSLRNVFRGNSSLLARCFLLRPEYASLTDLGAFALERFCGGKSDTSHLTKGTVSKVVQLLEEENIVVRQKEGVRLTAPDVLLGRLKTHYRKSEGVRLEGKISLGMQQVWDQLSRQSFRTVMTGEGSAGHYRVLSGPDKWQLYVEDLESARQCLEVTPTPLFPNVELIEEAGDTVYFDARSEGAIRWASPVQTWLELANSGSREQAAAEVLETILRKGAGDTL